MTYYQNKSLNYSLELPPQNPLFQWVKTANIEKLSQEIQSLETLDTTDGQGNSLNKIAANHKQQAVLDWFYQFVLTYFTEKGEIDCNKQDYKQRTIIHWAAKCNQPKSLFEKLILLGADINKADNPFHVTPLYLAASDNCACAIQALLSLGADVTIQAVNGASALHVACENGNMDIISQLMDAKADINKTCLQNGTPLFIAANKGHLDVVNKLITAHADLEKAYAGKMTALVAAMQNQDINIVKALLAAKAKTDYPLPNGWSLKEFAEQSKIPELIELF